MHMPMMYEGITYITASNSKTSVSPMYLSLPAAHLAVHRSTLMCRNGPCVVLFNLAAASVNATFVAE